ncbi:MAG: exo-alpha-sialidase [Planctomycetes bacterium]|nr:exo-alpha-sialidase [Planctomycetota bacterium]
MSDRIYVSTRKGLFTVEPAKGGGSHGWEITHACFEGDNVTLVLPDHGDGTLYAALDHGHFGVKLHRSPDDGRSWEECAVPVYPELKEGEEPDINPMSGEPIPSSLKLIWALEHSGDGQSGHLWCGTLPGGLFRSTDGGTSWNLVRSLWDHPSRKKWFGGGMDWAGIHTICVDPRDSRRVILGVSCGGVWVTDDGGETWACRADGMWASYMPPESKNDPDIQDPHRIAQCRANPDVLWAQHHNGVFRTTDGCKSWQEITTVKPSTFGFGVAVHPADPDTAWFVPAINDEKRVPVDGKVVVARTRDGGATFDVLRNGLPQRYAYDLTFRHALDVDETGDRLVFGSTTGGLWISEDQGDSWETVATHLPPIYCTRFVK